MGKIEPGQIYLMDLGCARDGFEERGKRPCLVVSSELHNQVNRTVIVVPLTKQTNKSYWHEHYRFQGIGINGPSVAMCEHVREVDKIYILGDVLGVAMPDDMFTIMNLLKEVTLA